MPKKINISRMENQPYFHTAKAMQDIRIFIEAAVAKIRAVFPYTASQSKTVAQPPKHPLSTMNKRSAPSALPLDVPPFEAPASPAAGMPRTARIRPFWAFRVLARGALRPGACRRRRGGVFVPGSRHSPGAFKVMRPWLSQGKNTLANGRVSSGTVLRIRREGLQTARAPTRQCVCRFRGRSGWRNRNVCRHKSGYGRLPRRPR